MARLRNIPDAGNEPWEACFAEERRLAVQACLKTLPSKLRSFLELNFGIGRQQLTEEELARLFAVHPMYVRSRISKAIRSIQQYRTKLLLPFLDQS
jgi:DNA-directed RNA polymerase specialized sigma24 family protein